VALACARSYQRAGRRWKATPQHRHLRHKRVPPTRAALILNIAVVNLWNRLNVPTRIVAGTQHH
jgi:hypothetical protein